MTVDNNALDDPEVIRAVPADALATSVIGTYVGWLRDRRGLQFSDYTDLHRWSVTELDCFWRTIWDFFEVRSRSAEPSAVLAHRSMPGASWFPGVTLNWAEHALRQCGYQDALALIERTQTRPARAMTRAELRDEVARVRRGLIRLGVGRGDRVAAYMPNITESVVAYLATLSLGAVWASCAPEFGHRAVVDRLAQIEPTVLFVVPGYVYGDKQVDRIDEVARIRHGLPTVRHVVEVPYGGGVISDAVTWDDLTAEDAPLEFEPVPFDHPMVVLFTSGTTGKPKPIIHSHGGLLLEQLKNLGLSWDLRVGDRLLWFSTTAWMLWNTVVAALLHGAAAVLVDGNPLYPSVNEQWRLAEETRATLVGVSPSYVMSCRREGIHPAETFDLSAVRQIGCAGAPLPEHGFRWLVDQFGPDVLVNVGSGGTDVCTGLVAASPLQPVYAGEMSGPALGCAVAALDEHGQAVTGELGELVITEPMPSMPVGFWGDADGSRYRESYFDMYPGVWRMGDWARFSEQGSVTITGRSDATLNRAGVRIGTADYYGVVEDVQGVVDSLVVHLEDADGGPGQLILFVAGAGQDLDEVVIADIKSAIRENLSPRHVPDVIKVVTGIPRNKTGKKLELPIKRILLGADPDTVLSRDSLMDPSLISQFLPPERSDR